MLNAVSCRTVDCIMQVLADRGIDAQQLVDGLPVTLGHLRDGAGWLSWPQYVALLRRYRELVGPDVADLTARQFVSASHSFDLARSIAGLFIDVRAFYWFNLKVAGVAFPCIDYTFDRLGDDLVHTVLSIPETFEDCRLFFEISGQVQRHLPTVLGLDVAVVDIAIRPREATFLTHVPRSPSTARALHALVTLPPRLMTSYRTELRDHFADIRARNPRYSLRAFARHIGVSAAMLSNVLAGKRNLSIETAHQVAGRLGYSPDQARRFCQLVQLGNVTSPALQSLLGS